MSDGQRPFACASEVNCPAFVGAARDDEAGGADLCGAGADRCRGGVVRAVGAGAGAGAAAGIDSVPALQAFIKSFFFCLAACRAGLFAFHSVLHSFAVFAHVEDTGIAKTASKVIRTRVADRLMIPPSIDMRIGFKWKRRNPVS